MKNLVGKTINKYQLSQDGETLVVYCEEGILTYRAFGD